MGRIGWAVAAAVALATLLAWWFAMPGERTTSLPLTTSVLADIHRARAGARNDGSAALRAVCAGGRP